MTIRETCIICACFLSNYEIENEYAVCERCREEQEENANEFRDWISPTGIEES
jgi:hypothetical protein